MESPKRLSQIETDSLGPKLFVHDISLSFQNFYPYELQGEKILEVAINCLKGASQFDVLKTELCKKENGTKLFDNLFWLFFALKFQPLSFTEFGVFY